MSSSVSGGAATGSIWHTASPRPRPTRGGSRHSPPSRLAAVRLLFIGDVVGGPGRRGLRETMPALRERYAPDLIVVNGENSAGGMGITERTANDIFDTGAAVITSGNHVYRHKAASPFIEREARVIRPANYPSGNPGRGHTTVEAGGMRGEVVHVRRGGGAEGGRSPFAPRA